jgi:molybdopterin-guanine dinucleotide biosynthesis protein
MGNVNFDALIRLSDSSYIADRFSTRPYFANFRNELRASGAVFLVGYSVPDLDIGQILLEEPNIREKTVVVISPTSTLEEQFQLKKFGNVQAIGVASFEQFIREAKARYIPRNAQEKLYAIRKFQFKDDSSDEITDRARFDLYIYGDFNPSLFIKQSQSERSKQYSVERGDVVKILNGIRKGPSLFVVHGHIASGKTVLVEQLASIASQRGYDVYFVDKSSEFLLDELDTVITKSSRPTIVIVENYERYQRELRFILEQYRANISLVVTSRTYIHQTNKLMLARINKQSLPSTEISVNKLRSAETYALSSVLLSEELKGAFLVSNIDNVKSIVETRCHSEMREVLLYLFRSEHVRKRLMAQFADANLHDNERRYLLICFIVRVLAVNLPVQEMEETFFARESFYAQFLTRDDIKEILRIDENGNIAASSAMAQFFITSMYSGREVREALITVVKTAFDMTNVDIFDELYRACIQYGKIRELFDPRAAIDEIVLFYDGAKNSDVVRANPYFWLQYGIARWAKKERDLTDTCIAEARRVGKEVSSFRDFQINNFEATVRLEQHELGFDRSTFKEDLKYAFRVFKEQIDDDQTKMFPLMMGVSFSRCVSRSVDQLNDREKSEIRTMFGSMERLAMHSDKAFAYAQETEDLCRRLQSATTALGGVAVTRPPSARR